MQQQDNTTTKQGTGTSFVELQTLEALTEAFIERELEATIKKKDGYGNYLNDATNRLNALQAFLVISKAMCANYSESAFSFQDCVTYGNHLLGLNRQFEYSILEELFNGWTAFLQNQNPPRATRIDGCYDHAVWSFAV